MRKLQSANMDAVESMFSSIPRTVLNWDDELGTPAEDFQDNLSGEIHLQLIKNACKSIAVVPEVSVKLLANSIYVIFNYFYCQEMTTISIDEDSGHLNSEAISLLLDTVKIDVNIVSEIELYLKFNKIAALH